MSYDAPPLCSQLRPRVAMPTSGRQLVRWRDSRYARMCVLLICQVRSVSRDTLTNPLRVPATGGISDTTVPCTNGPELKLDTHSTNNSDLSSFHEGEKRGIHSRIRCKAHLKTQPRKMQTNTQASVVLGLPHDPCPPSVSSIIFFTCSRIYSRKVIRVLFKSSDGQELY